MIAACILGAAGLPGAWFLLPDTLFFAALFAIGTYAICSLPQAAAAPIDRAATSSAG